MELSKPIQNPSFQIQPIQSFTNFTSEPSKTEGDNKFSFDNIMATQLKGVNEAQNASYEMTKAALMTGEVKNPHDVAIAGEKASVMLKLATQVCSKVTSSIQTLMQMQI
jgi:flagellar hook-basal body complex protein FliE